jgi:hypothetical protein
MKLEKRTPNRMEFTETPAGSVIISMALAGITVAILLENGRDGYPALLLLALAAWMLIDAKRVRVGMDTAAMRIDISVKTLLGEKKQQIAIGDVDHVEVREVSSTTKDSEGCSNTGRDYEIRLVRNEGTPVLLNKESATFRVLSFGRKSKYRKAGQRIAEFLAVPFTQTSS